MSPRGNFRNARCPSVPGRNIRRPLLFTPRLLTKTPPGYREVKMRSPRHYRGDIHHARCHRFYDAFGNGLPMGRYRDRPAATRSRRFVTDCRFLNATTFCSGLTSSFSPPTPRRRPRLLRRQPQLSRPTPRCNLHFTRLLPKSIYQIPWVSYLFDTIHSVD